MATAVAEPRGLRGYAENMRLFSRNARLYLVHIAGMDLVHGTWDVLFNLYLLALFTHHPLALLGREWHAIEFIALRLAVQAVASGIIALPAGLVADRIGRKASFVLGDGGGAVVFVVNITVTNPWILLLTPLPQSFFGNLHHVTESAFMMENSRRRERVHLFSVGSAMSTAVVMVGSLIAAAHPTFLAWFADQLVAYRAASVIGIVVWFLSLIPALLLREQRPEDDVPARSSPEQPASAGLGRLLADIRHPVTVAQLVAVGALMSVGSAAALPYLNLFFHEHLHAEETEIGLTFATAAGFLAIGALLAPFVGERFGKVRGVTALRLVAVPLLLVLAFSPEVSAAAGAGGSLLTLAGAAVACRAMLMSMAGPLARTFSMEVLDRRERATMVGLETAAGSLLRAGATALGGFWMAGGQYHAPFLLTAGCFVVATVLFWVFFRHAEPVHEPVLEPVAQPAPQPVASAPTPAIATQRG
ncbi:MAG: MFS transporter [Chloroflexi bacterium]|nr:MFS transporter [Chloroflexota bacterium]